MQLSPHEQRQLQVFRLLKFLNKLKVKWNGLSDQHLQDYVTRIDIIELGAMKLPEKGARHPETQ